MGPGRGGGAGKEQGRIRARCLTCQPDSSRSQGKQNGGFKSKSLPQGKKLKQGWKCAQSPHLKSQCGQDGAQCNKHAAQIIKQETDKIRKAKWPVGSYPYLRPKCVALPPRISRLSLSLRPVSSCLMFLYSAGIKGVHHCLAEIFLNAGY